MLASGTAGLRYDNLFTSLSGSRFGVQEALRGGSERVGCKGGGRKEGREGDGELESCREG